MFNTDIIHFLQQFDSPILYWLMVLISAVGTTPIILPFILAITFGVDFKKGLVLVNIIAWTAIITFVLKDQINYPRPVDIDTSVKTIYYDKAEVDLAHFQPQKFLESFSPDLLNSTRNDEWERFGFPSGHSSIQVALWISLFYLFRKRRIAYFGAFMVIATLISRMYLAHHFLGDVIGGVIVGLTVSSLLLILIHKTKYLNRISHQFKSFSILWIPVFIVPFVQYTPIWIVGSMIGFNIASALIILQRNFPVFHVIPWKRILTAIITLAIVFSAYLLNSFIEEINKAGIELFIVILINVIVVWGSLTLNDRLNLIRFRF